MCSDWEDNEWGEPESYIVRINRGATGYVFCEGVGKVCRTPWGLTREDAEAAIADEIRRGAGIDNITVWVWVELDVKATVRIRRGGDDDAH